MALKLVAYEKRPLYPTNLKDQRLQIPTGMFPCNGMLILQDVFKDMDVLSLFELTSNRLPHVEATDFNRWRMSRSITKCYDKKS